MNLVIALNGNRIAPILEGSALQLVAFEQNTFTMGQQLITDEWSPSMWGRELLRYEVNILICGGIDRFFQGALQGNGIQIVSNITGTLDDVLRLWKSGQLKTGCIWTDDGRYFPGQGICQGKRLRRRKGCQ